MTTQAGRLNDNYKPEGKVTNTNNKVASNKKSKGAFRTISEVAEELGVQQHVLRFWETKFSQVRPLKRGGGRRYYRPEDVAVLKRIYELLYTEGYTIKGVQKLFRANGKHSVMEGEVGGAANTDLNVKVSNAGTSVETNTVTTSENTQQQVQDNIVFEAEQDLAPTIIKQGLSDTQRVNLHAALSELKELRALVQAG